MKKIILTAFAALMALAVFTGCEYNNVDYSQIEEITYTGDSLIEFIGGLGTKNSDGNVEITPNGWSTSADLSKTIKSGETLLAFSVEAKVEANNVQGTVQFLNSDWSHKVPVTFSKTDFNKVDIKPTDVSKDLTKLQFFIQDTKTWDPTTDQKLVIKSITIKQIIN